MSSNDMPFRTSSPGPANAPGARASQRSLGAILVAAGRLDASATPQILARQRSANQQFGEAAISLGLLTPADVELALARQFDSPCLLQGNTDMDGNIVLALQPAGAQAEALRMLRTELMHRWFSAPGQHALAITSAHAREGRSFLAANLAVGFAQLGQRTLLIDADLRNPSQHVLFGLSNRVGLSALLTGRAGSESVESVDGLSGLSVLVSGMTPPNPAELLGRPAFGKLLGALARYYDVVLIDTPPGADRVDARSVAISARGALVVARKDVSPLGGVTRLADSMSQSGVTVLGAVLNEF